MADAQPIHPAPELPQPAALGQWLIDHRVGHDPAHDREVSGQALVQLAQEVFPLRQGLHRGLADAIEVDHPTPHRLFRTDRRRQCSNTDGGTQFVAEPTGPPAQGLEGSEEGAHHEQQQAHGDQIDRQAEALMQGGVGQLQQQAGPRQQRQGHQPQQQEQQQATTTRHELRGEGSDRGASESSAQSPAHRCAACVPGADRR